MSGSQASTYGKRPLKRPGIVDVNACVGTNQSEFVIEPGASLVSEEIVIATLRPLLQRQRQHLHALSAATRGRGAVLHTAQCARDGTHIDTSVLKAAHKLALYNEGATNASQMINNERTSSTLAIEFFRPCFARSGSPSRSRSCCVGYVFR